MPVVGWVLAGVEMANAVHDAGPKISAMTFAVNSASYVQTYMMFRTVADETKVNNGHQHMDSTELGSFVDGMGPGTKEADPTGQDTAEAAPLYDAVMGNHDPATTPVSGVATSASGPDSHHICDNGKPVASGKLRCDEENLLHKNNISNLANIASAATGGPQHLVIAFIDGTAGRLLRFLGNTTVEVACAAPPISLVCTGLQKAIEPVMSALFDWITEHFFQTIIKPDMAGGRTFTVVTGGAMVLGQQTCQHQLGCQKITPQQFSTTLNEQRADELATFKQRPLMARMFDTSTPYSLASQVALALPTSWAHFFNATSAYMLSDPLGKLSRSISTLFTPPHAYAVSAGAVAGTALGVDLYGYPADSIPTHPEDYWNAHCVDGEQTKAWNEAAAKNVDPDNGMAQNTTTDPCLLIQASTASSGAMFTSDVLTQDDLYGSTPAGVATPPAAGGTGATDIVSGSTPQIPCSAGSDQGVADGYQAGTKYSIRLCNVQGITVNSQISKNVDSLLNAAKAAGLPMTGYGFRTMQTQISLYNQNCSGGACHPATAQPGYSNHQMGLAIDFGNQGMSICYPYPSSACSGNARFDWMKANAANYGLKNLPSEAWHWSVDGH